MASGERRGASRDELRLLRFLGRASRGTLPDDWLDGMLVEDMSDGGMGSLRLLPGGVAPELPRLIRVLAACMFKDADDVVVIATIYATPGGVPFELDMWKVDSAPLIRIPSEFEDLEEHHAAPKGGET